MKNNDTSVRKKLTHERNEPFIDNIPFSCEKKTELTPSASLVCEHSVEKFEQKRVDSNNFIQFPSKLNENVILKTSDPKFAVTPVTFSEVYKTEFQDITLSRNFFPNDEKDCKIENPSIPQNSPRKVKMNKINLLEGLAKDVVKMIGTVRLTQKDSNFICVCKNKDNSLGQCYTNTSNSINGYRLLLNQYNNEYSNNDTHDRGMFYTIENANDINIVFDDPNENSIGVKNFSEKQKGDTDESSQQILGPSLIESRTQEKSKEKKQSQDIKKNTGILNTLTNSPCHCKRSKCLQFYCECFARDAYCSNCNCQNCENNETHSLQRETAKNEIKKKNPKAFQQKTEHKTTNKGCNCMKSMCKKKYCECFHSNNKCQDYCRCRECRNKESNKNLSNFGMISTNQIVLENSLKQMIPKNVQRMLVQGIGSDFVKRKRGRFTNLIRNKSKRKAKSVSVQDINKFFHETR